MTIEKIIFVYNADSSLFSLTSDFVKKIVTPDKYECSLCMITYGAIGMKKDWKKFIDTLPYELSFLHKDQFKKEYYQSDIEKFPVVLIKTEDGLKEVIGPEKLDSFKDFSELQAELTKVLSDYEN